MHLSLNSTNFRWPIFTWIFDFLWALLSPGSRAQAIAVPALVAWPLYPISSDADLERLYEQWEEDDEPLPVDELPEWDPRRPQPTFDLNAMKQFKNPEEFLKVSKKGKTLMIFVKVRIWTSFSSKLNDQLLARLSQTRTLTEAIRERHPAKFENVDNHGNLFTPESS